MIKNLFLLVKVICVVLSLQLLFSCTANSTQALVTDSALKNRSLPVVDKVILTPAIENNVLAEFYLPETKKKVTVREYDVFGLPNVYTIRKKIKSSKRAKSINNYLFDKLIQAEAQEKKYTSFPEFKSFRKKIHDKVAVKRFFDLKIAARFVTDKMVKDYYEQNKKDYPEGYDKSSIEILRVLSGKDRRIATYANFYLDSVRKDYGVAYNDSLLQKISNLSFSDKETLIKSLKKIGAEKNLIDYNKTTIRVRDLIRKISEMKPYHIVHYKSVKMLKNLLDGDISNEILMDLAQKNGVYELPEVIAAVDNTPGLLAYMGRKYKENYLLESNLNIVKDDLYEYYLAHKTDKELSSSKKMWVTEIFKKYDNKDDDPENDKIKVAIELEGILEKIKGGEKFEKYAKLYYRPQMEDGVLGFIYKDDYAKIGEVADTLKSGEVSELIYQQKAISIVKVSEIKEAQLYKFDYVEPIVKERVLQLKRKQKEDELKNELFNKYNVKLY